MWSAHCTLEFHVGGVLWINHQVNHKSNTRRTKRLIHFDILLSESNVSDGFVWNYKVSDQNRSRRGKVSGYLVTTSGRQSLDEQKIYKLFCARTCLEAWNNSLRNIFLYRAKDSIRWFRSEKCQKEFTENHDAFRRKTRCIYKFTTLFLSSDRLPANHFTDNYSCKCSDAFWPLVGP